MTIFYGYQYERRIDSRPIASKAQYRVSFLNILIERVVKLSNNDVIGY